MRCGSRGLSCALRKPLVELGWEEAWAGMSLYALAGTWRNEQLGELLGKVAEAANMNEFERLEKTEGRGKNAGKWHSAEPNLICCLHWIGPFHPCPSSINSQWPAVVQTWVCLCMFLSLQLYKYDRVLNRGRGQWLLGWVPPAGKAFRTLLIEGLGKTNRPWPVIQSQAQHGLVHSTNVLWKHIVSSGLMAGALLVIELGERKIGKGESVGRGE